MRCQSETAIGERRLALPRLPVQRQQWQGEKGEERGKRYNVVSRDKRIDHVHDIAMKISQ